MEKFIKKVSHYNQGKYECIEVMREIFGDVIVIGFIIGSAFKYLWRFREKGGAADLIKSRDYLCRLSDEDLATIEKMIAKQKKIELFKESDEVREEKLKKILSPAEKAIYDLIRNDVKALEKEFDVCLKDEKETKSKRTLQETVDDIDNKIKEMQVDDEKKAFEKTMLKHIELKLKRKSEEDE